MYQKNLKRYRATQILTAEPARLTLMLYDAVLNNMEQAAELAEKKMFPERAEKIIRCNKILMELLASLNFENGGEIAANLREIYVFLLGELKKADLKNDAHLIRQCKAVLSEIREAWSTITTKQTDSPRQDKMFVQSV